MERRGVTLIELLIALTITMVMMGAVVTLFANMTTSVTDSRAVIEVSERMRAARNLLQNDLAGHTTPTRPSIDPGADLGYLELIDGPNFDSFGTVVPTNAPATTITYNAIPINMPSWPNQTTTNNVMGDCDDVLMTTVRSSDKPFVGRVGPVMMESQNAEIIWFAVPNGRTMVATPTSAATSTSAALNNSQPIQLYTLYRRVLLLLPGYNLQGAGVDLSSPANAQQFFLSYDVSAHYDQVTHQTVANTLGDLTKRENRYCHGVYGNNLPANFPFALNITPANMANLILTGSRLGEDVVLDNVLAFDIRVFDPVTPMRTGADGTVLVPSDAGWSAANTTAIGYGAFVDLGYANKPGVAGAASFFSNMPVLKSGLSATAATYDTWSTHYEQNGTDEDSSGTADQGTNGVDDGSDGIVDNPPSIVFPNPIAGVAGSADAGECETLPPYPAPLRGVQVQIRVYEPDSRQVRQVTIVQDFVPE